MKERYRNKKVKCKIDDCNNKAHCNDLCPTHYTRLWRHNNINFKNSSKLNDPLRASINAVYGKYKDRAINKNMEFKITIDNFIDLTKLNCHYCNSEPISSYKTGTGLKRFIYNGLDRINNKIGYTLNNVVPCCKVCNRAKGTMELVEFKIWINNLKDNIS